jgi:hypothetical protein
VLVVKNEKIKILGVGGALVFSLVSS